MSELRTDINDRKPWDDMADRDLAAALEHGRTIEEAAQHLCRSGSVDDVARRADVLGLAYRHELRLVPTSKVYPQHSWGPDRFTVVAGDRIIGTIVREDLSGDAVGWWWEITTSEAQRHLAREIKGPAATRKAAMQAFRAAWDRLDSKKAPPGDRGALKIMYPDS